MEDVKTESAAATVSQSKSIVQTLSETFNNFKNGNVTQGTATLIQEIVVPAGIGLLGLMAVYFISKLIARRISSVICRRVDETLGKFIGKMVFYSIMIIACVAILSRVGFEVSGFMAVLATAGFAIGLAFQGTLSNFSAGILLLVFRPFKVGDSVNIANVMGKVNEIDLFTTTLDTPDNRRLIIPNSSIASSTIENISYHPHRRVEVMVGVEYSANVELTRQALTQAIEAMGDMVIPGEGRGYQIILSNLGASSVDWTVRAWVAKDNFFAAKEQITHQIKATLAQFGIGIPFPQMHLHMSAPIAQTIQTKAAQSPSTQGMFEQDLSTQESSGPRVDSPSLSIPTIHSGSPSKVRPRVRGESADRNG